MLTQTISPLAMASLQDLPGNELVRRFNDLFSRSQFEPAFDVACAEVMRYPALEYAAKRAALAVQKIEMRGFHPLYKQAIVHCFQALTIEHRHFMFAWLALMTFDPLHRPLMNLMDAEDENDFDRKIDWKTIRPCVMDPFFQLGIRKLMVADIPFELLLTRLRRFVLTAHKTGSILTADDLPFLCALSEYFYEHEYAAIETPSETDLISGISEKSDDISLAVLGCYRLLHPYPQAQKRALDKNLSGDIKTLLSFHVIDRNEEADIKKNIPALTTIDDAISKNVADMYEDNPYPRWRGFDLPPVLYPVPRSEILVAGCGTSKWVVQTAMTFPNVHITGIDLSRSSIAYGVRSARQVGAFNTYFAQGDILKLDQMDKQFDLIESSGVLHHMKDPDAGFKQVVGRLKPGGRMFIALYSELGRQSIVECRKLIAEKGFSITPEGMRQFRADIISLPDEDPLKQIAMRRDFFSLSECRDLVFHIQETRYTIEDLKNLLNRHNLTFLGFREQAKALQEKYISLYPDDPRMTNLDNWEKFEQAFPLTFANMYQFVCCRREEENTPSEGFAQIDACKFFSIGRTI
ncbi:MAG: methyltransferase domain-containing protein [Alphaproteobacteria bacterium]|nr:methyltransferase domain-containing protein [Alphaproteobacteria bacterium]